ncbi:Type 1 phosphatases regulator ypi1 [Penicillium malachiteum]|nr:Type 1 phosphatases regulator ypi1 [Penicillium malachiteum]
MSQSRQPQNSHLQSSTQTSRDSSTVRLTGTLRLRGEETPASTDEPPARRIRWSEDVVDNEGMGKKSSKVCCIYHKARPVGESSSEESSSDSSDDSDSDVDYSKARSTNNHRPRDADSGEGPSECRGHGHGHGHSHTKKIKRKPSPNAYEKMPKHKSKN